MKKISFYLLVSLLYLSVFILIFGYYILDVKYVDWMIVNHPHIDGDLAGNFLNFLVFFNSDNLPPFFDYFSLSKHSSCIAIDSIPFVSFWCKLFFFNFISKYSFIYFQYSGLWGCLCFILQGLFSYLILSFSKNKFNVLLCSLFFVLAPPFIYRFPNNYSLCSHFLILISFFPFVFNFKKKQNILLWFLLAFFAVGIHSYFLPVLFINLIALVIYNICKKRCSLKFSVFLIFSFIFGFFISYYCFGGFVSYDSYNIGVSRCFVFNLNQFFNPNEYFELFSSNLFPCLNGLNLYYPFENLEGFSYLGGGFICLLIFSIIILLFKYNLKSILNYIKKYKIEFCVFIVAFVFILLLSTGFDITCGNKMLVSIPLPDFIENNLLGVFRSKGRFIWTDFYLIYFVVFAFILKNLRTKTATIILSIALCLQVYDIFPALQKLHNEYAVKKYCCDLPFDSYITENLFKNKKYLFSLNYGMFEKEVRPYYNLSYFALKNDIKMSYFGYSYISPHLNNDFVIYRLNFPEKDDLFVFNMDEYYNETTGDFDAEKAITYIKYNTAYKNCYKINNYIFCALYKIEELDDCKIEIN